MLKIYGIHNCDTVQKALKWLDKKGVKYVFHNFKEQGLDKATIEAWLKYLPLDKVVNARSTTFKELPESDRKKATDKAKAIALMMEHNSIIKRPVWDFGNGKMFLGWDEKTLTELVG
jgi:arsenate reductase